MSTWRVAYVLRRFSDSFIDGASMSSCVKLFLLFPNHLQKECGRVSQRCFLQGSFTNNVFSSAKEKWSMSSCDCDTRVACDSFRPTASNKLHAGIVTKLFRRGDCTELQFPRDDYGTLVKGKMDHWCHQHFHQVPNVQDDQFLILKRFCIWALCGPQALTTTTTFSCLPGLLFRRYCNWARLHKENVLE